MPFSKTVVNINKCVFLPQALSMRTLSAIAFVISIIGLLLACYNQFALVPFLDNVEINPQIKSDEFTVALRQKYESQQFVVSMLCIILGVFSVLFCTTMYLNKRTRMTFVGTFIGLLVAVLGIVYSWF